MSKGKRNYSLDADVAHTPECWLLMAILVQCKREYTPENKSITTFLTSNWFEDICDYLGLNRDQVEAEIQKGSVGERVVIDFLF